MRPAPLDVRAVLFDLDGTLADTAPDLAAALNKQLQAREHPALPVEAVRQFVSQGARGMLRVGFGLTPQDADYPALRDEFLRLYAMDLCNESQLFPGMLQLLEQLEQRGLAWGIVSNKQEHLTLKVVQGLGLLSRAACVIGGDTTGRAKPHPDSLLEASRRLDLSPADCCYVGDDERDVQASVAAGMTPVVALYGYLGADKPPAQWGAQWLIERPLDLLKLLGPAPSMG